MIPTFRTTLTSALPVVAAAILAAVLVWLLAVPLADVDLAVGSGPGRRRIGLFAVVATALLAGLAATGLAALLPRCTGRPRRTWLIIGSGTLVVSLVGPLGAAGVGAGAVLVALHLAVGGVLLLGLARTWPRRSAR